jgi:peptide/nickel transport system substrate-binding protein
MADIDTLVDATIGRRRLTRRGFVLAGVGTAGLALLAACGGKEPTPTATTSAAAPTTGASGGEATSTSGSGTGGSATESTSATAPAGDATETAPAEIEHKTGGILKVAMIGEPPVVADAMFTTTTVTSDITRQIYEGLFAQDSKFGPQPMLVDEHEISDDGLNYTFKLREGIKFHSGKDLTSEDVVESLNRWAVLTGRGKMIYARLAEDGVKAADPTTVTMTFTEPAGVLLNFLAEIEAFIMPADIAKAAGKDKLADEQIDGTGPFMFKEHQVDRLIRLVRYDGYVARDETPDGLTGKKTAYLHELQVIPVPDVTVATNGVITGEYHYATTVDNDQYDTIANDPNVSPVIVKPGGWLLLNYQKAQGPFTNKVLRQAVSMCFDRQQALIAAYGRQELTRMDPGIAGPETIWGSQVGNDVYTKVDPEQAKTLLQEAGYNGETLRWLTTKEYPYHYNTAAYIKQEMEAIGMKVELVVSDWATVVQRRGDPSVYEMIITGLSSRAHPATQPFNDKAWPGFWDNADKDEILDRLIAESDPDKVHGIIEEYQALIYEELPFIKIGDNFSLQAIRKEVKGFESGLGWFFWNTSLA